MDIICPKGHHSTDTDYCSECGAKIDGASSAIATAITNQIAPAPAPSASGEVCPDCGTPRANGAAVFCEICRYNFSTHQSWSAPAMAATPAPIDVPPIDPSPPPVDIPVSVDPAPIVDPGPPQVEAPTIASGEFVGWQAILSIDGSLYTEPDPNLPLPADPDRMFPLDLAENLIGRRSDRKDIHPEINVNDSGVSHRHAKLTREQDGSFSLLDLGSTNGTRLNGADIEAGVSAPLKDGDQITMGYWSRLAIRGIRS